MRKPIVSVLIPVYNISEYLERCLDSIIEQTLSNIEIICVNDGSTDNSAEILEKYKAKDARIKIVHKENGGLPSARNAGLDAAKGKYVGFVDGDDYIERDMFKKMVQTAENDNADVVICGANIFPETPRANDWLYACLSPSYTKYEKFDPEITFKRVDTNPFLWRVMVRREIIEKKHLRLDEDIHIGEDKAFQNKVYAEAERITVIPDKLYNYFWCRPNSLMEQQVYGKLEKRIMAHAKLIERMCNDLKNINFENEDETKFAFFDWSIPFIYDDFMYLPLENKSIVSSDLKKAWNSLGYYKYGAKLDKWKQSAYEYVCGFEDEFEHKPMLSIIIPIEYHSRYIQETIREMDKIVDNNIEVIIINNGMNNESYIKVQEFLYRNKRVRLLNSPKHFSYAEALNHGTDLACGDYMAFLDTTDWFESKKQLEDWLEFALLKNADVCACNFQKKCLPEEKNAISLTCNNVDEKILEMDFHNFLYKKSFLKENKIIFKNASILTGMKFLVNVMTCAKTMIAFNENVYVHRDLHVADWIPTDKCEVVLDTLDKMIDISLNNRNAYIHGKVYSLLNGDKIKTLIVNNTKPYCMPTAHCPNGENSQIKTVKSLFSIVSKADEVLLKEYGYKDNVNLFATLYEVIAQRHKFLSDL